MHIIVIDIIELPNLARTTILGFDINLQLNVLQT